MLIKNEFSVVWLLRNPCVSKQFCFEGFWKENFFLVYSHYSYSQHTIEFTTDCCLLVLEQVAPTQSQSNWDPHMLVYLLVLLTGLLKFSKFSVIISVHSFPSYEGLLTLSFRLIPFLSLCIPLFLTFSPLHQSFSLFLLICFHPSPLNEQNGREVGKDFFEHLSVVYNIFVST